MTSKSSSSFEQSSFTFLRSSSPTVSPPKDQIAPKKPFVPPLLQAIDPKEIKNNFMITLRMLINAANKQPNILGAQHAFAETLLAEMSIKRGLKPLDVATRTAVLKNQRPR